MFDKAGHHEVAERLWAEVVGRNVLDGRRTLQVVDEFDDLYYSVIKRFCARVERELVAGRRHVYEAELKERRRTAGAPGHDAAPAATQRQLSAR